MGNNWMINVQKLFSFLGKLQRIIGQGWGCRVQCPLTPIYSIYHPARENCAKTCDWSDALSKEALCLIKFCDCGSFLRSCLVPGKKPQVIDKSISYFGSCVVEYDEHYGAELRQTYRFLHEKTTLRSYRSGYIFIRTATRPSLVTLRIGGDLFWWCCFCETVSLRSIETYFRRSSCVSLKFVFVVDLGHGSVFP